ncbi:heparinase II/III-like protein [gut metagenome]|uniref:Heparinase II/III-like protein n=1 Tax=gut metagenome TaxID=749906 RepID=J9GRX1_9ZZZZ
MFEKLNLDYPGLEKVKEFYEKNEHFYAANALLEYFRTRNNISNPNVNLINPTLTLKDQHIAEQANEYRFYVKNYAEKVDETTKEETYYKFYNENDKKIDWAAQSSLEQKEQEFRYQLHRHQWMLPQAKAYRISRNEDYVLKWIETYQSWLDTFPYEPGTKFPPEGGNENDVDYQWKGLQVAERVLSQVNILPYMIQSTNFTPEWLFTFLTAFEKEVECIRLNYYKDGNILISQYQAVATAGILMPEFKAASEWATEGANGLNHALDSQFNEDGIEFELDPSYHIAAISDFRDIYLLAEANQRTDLLSPSYINKLKKATEFVMDIIYPNYTLDNFNDTRSSSYPKSVLLRNLREYTEMYPDDQELLWMATEGKSGQQPTYTLKAYDKSGYYMLRNGWTADATMMILKNNYNPNKEWHCQPDNGTFGLYHKGRNFFPDAGTFSYNTGKDRTKFASTVNHNTMTIMSKTIGDKDIPGSVMEGKMIWSKIGDKTDILVTENNQGGTVTHRRTVFFVNREFFILVDEGYSPKTESDKNVNINFHLLSDKDTPAVFVTKKQTSDKGHSYFKGYTNFESNNMMTATFAEIISEDKYSSSVLKDDKVTDVSNTLNKIDGPLRLGYQITLRQPTKKQLPNAEERASRFITILYPFETAADREALKIDAYFTDNEPAQAGTFHPEGAKLEVKINGKVYKLSSIKKN